MLSLIHALKSSQSTGSALSNIFSVHTAQHMPLSPFLISVTVLVQSLSPLVWTVKALSLKKRGRMRTFPTQSSDRIPPLPRSRPGLLQ